MRLPEDPRAQRIPLSRSQQNIYHGVLRDGDPRLYRIGRRYRFAPIPRAEFLRALHKTILANPIQLCVLTAPADDGDHPDLVPRLSVEEIVSVCADDHDAAGPAHAWESGIVGKPLVRYIVRVDGTDMVRAMEAYAHHILLDGGAIGVIEADLGHFLAGGASPESVTDGLVRVASAHRREAARIDESRQRLTAVVQGELTAAAADRACRCRPCLRGQGSSRRLHGDPGNGLRRCARVGRPGERSAQRAGGGCGDSGRRECAAHHRDSAGACRGQSLR